MNLIFYQRLVVNDCLDGGIYSYKSNDKKFYSKIISKAEINFLKHIDDIQRIKDED